MARPLSFTLTACRQWRPKGTVARGSASWARPRTVQPFGRRFSTFALSAQGATVASLWTLGCAGALRLPSLSVARSWALTMGQAGLISMAGDITCQIMCSGDDLQGVSLGKAIAELDVRRTLSFGFFSCLYGGVAQRLVYRYFDAWLGTGRALSKLALDTCVHAPLIYLPSFFLLTGALLGRSLQETLEHGSLKYREMMTAYVCIWPLPMLLCFSCVPEHRRVLFICTVGFFEKMVFSYIGNRK